MLYLKDIIIATEFKNKLFRPSPPIHFLILFTFLLHTLFLMCSPKVQKNKTKEECDFELANIKNTVIGYEEFVKNYPQGKLFTDAKENIEFLLNERDPAFRDARSAKVYINESYGIAKVSFSMWISEDDISAFLNHAGLKQVDKDYDIAVKININGTPLGMEYMDGYHYSGASISGNIVIENKFGKSVRTDFKGKRTPPNSIREGLYQSPDDAPFFDLVNGCFFEYFPKEIAKAFGMTSLINALKDDDRSIRETAEVTLQDIDPKWSSSEAAKNAVPAFMDVLKDTNSYMIFVFKRVSAAEVLGKIKDPRAVDALISAHQKDKSNYVRDEAYKSLKSITGEDFGQDPEKWEKWRKSTMGSESK